MSDAAILPGKTSYYMPAVRQNGDHTADWYALVVRVDKDGSEHVIHGYKGRSFATEDKAIKSCENYIKKNGLNVR
jgi:hypothetical protein